MFYNKFKVKDAIRSSRLSFRNIEGDNYKFGRKMRWIKGSYSLIDNTRRGVVSTTSLINKLERFIGIC